MRIPISETQTGVMYTHKYHTYDSVRFVPDYIGYFNEKYGNTGRRMTYGEYKKFVKELEIKRQDIWKFKKKNYVFCVVFHYILEILKDVLKMLTKMNDFIV